MLGAQQRTDYCRKSHRECGSEHRGATDIGPERASIIIRKDCATETIIDSIPVVFSARVFIYRWRWNAVKSVYTSAEHFRYAPERRQWIPSVFLSVIYSFVLRDTHTSATLTTLIYLRFRLYQREFNGRTEADGDNVIAEVLKRKNHTQPHTLFHTVTHKRNYNPL